MVKHIGDLGIAVAFLAVILSSFILFFNSADDAIGVTTSVATGLEGLNNTQEEYQTYETSFFNQIDNTTVFEVEENILLDKRGTAEAGLTREENENSITNFINLAKQETNVHPLISGFLISLVTLTGGILLFRSILGDSRW